MRTLLGVLAALALAAPVQAASGKSGQMSGVTEIKDVETLKDNIDQYEGKKVAVTGEVEDKIGTKSFTLESGGIANDEILVLADATLAKKIKDDEEVRVIGVVRKSTKNAMQGHMGTDFTPDVEARLKTVKVVLVAESVAPVRND